jgi:diaminohydroxyphosphoribosylaminopyrimidine deaminase / 5-amino-6-(5-phosphoribosylamino)uracil reductase
MQESENNKFMRRCLDLAVRAEGRTYPNPLVGSVVVHEGVVIGEGYHLKAGMPHAEVNAINSVSDKSLLAQSTLYVSLEPCNHSGKTPPCTDLIIKERIPRVVVGTIDTSDKVSGKGIEVLKKAGCKVISGVLETDCRILNRRFFTFHEKKRPYITLKWAQSADGYIDTVRSDAESARPNWITGNSERVLVHKWRAEEETILVGAGTARIDNPRLNVRYWSGKDPLKIIVSRGGDLSKYLSDNETICLVFAYKVHPGSNRGNIKVAELKDGIPSALQVIDYLYSEKIQSLFIEGGAEILNHFIENKLWDEARIFTGKVNFNDGVRAPSITGKIVSDISFEKSGLKVVRNE